MVAEGTGWRPAVPKIQQKMPPRIVSSYFIRGQKKKGAENRPELNARVERMPVNIRIQWNAGTACVSECVLKTLVCRGLRVGPSKP